jgi:hypothetical protein
LTCGRATAQCCSGPSWALAAAQLKAWEHAIGWVYWSYKLQVDAPEFDGWDMGKAIELGYLPEDLSDEPEANLP